MSRVEELLQQLHRRAPRGRGGGSGRVPPRGLRRRARRACGADRPLPRAGTGEGRLTREAFERFRADPRWQALAERILAPTLEELRAEAELSKREVADALAQRSRRRRPRAGGEGPLPRARDRPARPSADRDAGLEHRWPGCSASQLSDCERSSSPLARELPEAAKPRAPSLARNIHRRRRPLGARASGPRSRQTTRSTRRSSGTERKPRPAGAARRRCQIWRADCALPFMNKRRLVISDHAAERFHSRVRPTLDPAAASAELSRLAALASLWPSLRCGSRSASVRRLRGISWSATS